MDCLLRSKYLSMRPFVIFVVNTASVCIPTQERGNE